MSCSVPSTSTSPCTSSACSGTVRFTPTRPKRESTVIVGRFVRVLVWCTTDTDPGGTARSGAAMVYASTSMLLSLVSVCECATV